MVEGITVFKLIVTLQMELFLPLPAVKWRKLRLHGKKIQLIAVALLIGNFAIDYFHKIVSKNCVINNKYLYLQRSAEASALNSPIYIRKRTVFRPSKKIAKFFNPTGQKAATHHYCRIPFLCQWGGRDYRQDVGCTVYCWIGVWRCLFEVNSGKSLRLLFFNNTCRIWGIYRHLLFNYEKSHKKRALQ